MFKKLMLLLIIIAAFLSVSIIPYAQEDNATERLLLLRKAKQRKQTTVAVEAYLLGNVLEVTVTARMYATKPKIYNLILVGPRLGRLSPAEKQVVYPKAEDEEVTFPTEDIEGGIIRFSKRIQEKESKGALTKELFKFKIPTDKIIRGKRYELRIKIEGMQMAGQPESFIFQLKNLPELLLK